MAREFGGAYLLFIRYGDKQLWRFEALSMPGPAHTDRWVALIDRFGKSNVKARWLTIPFHQERKAVN